MAVTSDLVDHTEDLHPAYKWEIGRRLALIALEADYHQKIVSRGPTFKSYSIQGNSIRLEFTNIGSGLISCDGLPLNSFAIAGKDGKFQPATASINNKTILVSAPGLSDPKYVRFGWDEASQPNLFNKEGLPAYPFRTDNFNDPVAVAMAGKDSFTGLHYLKKKRKSTNILLIQ